MRKVKMANGRVYSDADYTSPACPECGEEVTLDETGECAACGAPLEYEVEVVDE